MRKFTIFCFLMLTIAVQGFCEDVFLNKKIKSGEKTIRSILLLPSSTYINMKGAKSRFLKESVKSLATGGGIFTGGPQTPAETEEVKDEALGIEVNSIVSSTFRQKGWQINDGDFSVKSLENDEKNRNLVDSLLADYELLVRRMLKRPKDVTKGRYSLGGKIADLKAPASIDAVAVVYGTPHWIPNLRYGPTWKKDGQPINTYLHISLLDPSTGEVLCYLLVPGAVEKRIADRLQKISQK